VKADFISLEIVLVDTARCQVGRVADGDDDANGEHGRGHGWTHVDFHSRYDDRGAAPSCPFDADRVGDGVSPDGPVFVVDEPVVEGAEVG
jgi:hypothetical protein